MSINFDTLFTRIGHFAKLVQDQDTSGTALVTTLRTAEDALDAEEQDFRQAVLGLLEQTLATQLLTMSTITQQLAVAPLLNLIVETVHQDTPMVNKTLDEALARLINQMQDNGETVDASSPSATVTYGENSSSAGTGDNYGDGVFLVCCVRGDGQTNAFVLPETIRCDCTAVSASGASTWTLQGEPVVSLLSPLWPGGSGIRTSVAMRIAASGIVPTGDMETADTYSTSLPSGWVMVTGTAGTNAKLTSVEQQTVTIGTPSSGYYTLTFTDRYGDLHTTCPLAYNASASAVQTALRTLPGLSSVTVSSTGTSPNVTHTVVFYDVPAPTQLNYTSNLSGGSPTITISTTVAGSAYVVRGARCLEFVGNGSTQTCLQAPVSVTGATCYGFNLWAAVDVVPAAGVLTVDLVDGNSGTTVTDDQGNANTLAIDLTGLSTAAAPFNVAFHTPSTLPARTYLRLRLSTALSSGTSLFVDELCLTTLTELYPGGIFVAAFAGGEGQVVGDYAELQISNAMEGQLHTILHRCLNLGGKRLLLPTDPPGTQTDALIA